jgi:hypothetical protein
MSLILAAAAGSARLARADTVVDAAFGDSTFGTIDLTTGAVTPLGKSGVTLAGLALQSSTLYAAGFLGGVDSLYSVNPANGALSAIGSTGVSINDFGATSSGLYALDGNGNLYSVSATTGAATLVGSTGLNINQYWDSLSTNSSTLYFNNGATLYTLNTTTGKATAIGTDAGGAQMGALLFLNGVLYGGQNPLPGAAVTTGSVDTLNTATGAATIVPGSKPVAGSFFGLAPIPVPLPAAAWLMISALGALGTLARRREAP